ncbi:hypothetical protein [Pyruvatibacter sp.]|uniref:hypothetical protein n=1 Tax=Pyruvatibacter sp. TaxID=1981328 RepID=UPI0032EADA53
MITWLVAGCAVVFGGIAAWDAVGEYQAVQIQERFDNALVGEQDQAAFMERVLEEQPSPVLKPSLNQQDLGIGRALLGLLGRLGDERRALAAMAAERHLRAALRRFPNAQGVWRSYVAARLVSIGPEVGLDRVAQTALQLDGGNPFTAITLVELVLRYPQNFSAATSSGVLASLPKLQKDWRMRRPVSRLYATLHAEGQRNMAMASDDPDQLQAWSRRYAP